MEYNAKMRAGIYGFAALVLIVCGMIAVTVMGSGGKEKDVPAAGKVETDDAILVNGVPGNFETLPVIPPPETTEMTEEKEEKPEKQKPVYYVAVSENMVVLLDANGEYVKTVNENISFLPKADIEKIRIGIPIYTDAELSMLLEDLS